MARVNKVVVPTHAVLANGGVIVRAGGHIIASAAAQHSVPVVCLAGIFKLSPSYAHDQDTFNEIGNPFEVLSFNEGSEGTGEAFIAKSGHRLGGAERAATAAARSSAFGRGRGLACSGMHKPYVDVVNPSYDYVGPELIDLHITNIGGTQPSYIYHLLAEYYSPEDHVL